MKKTSCYLEKNAFEVAVGILKGKLDIRSVIAVWISVFIFVFITHEDYVSSQIRRSTPFC